MDRAAQLANAYRRGALRPDQATLYEEAARRGLVSDPYVQGRLKVRDMPSEGVAATFSRAVPGLSEFNALWPTAYDALQDALHGRRGPNDGFAADWKGNRDWQQGEIDEFRHSHPITANMSEGAGNFGPGLATMGATTGVSAAAGAVRALAPTAARTLSGAIARAAPVVARNAFTGAALGGVYGFSRPGTLEQRAAAAKASLLPGAAAGVVLPAAVGAAGKAVSVAADAVAPHLRDIASDAFGAVSRSAAGMARRLDGLPSAADSTAASLRANPAPRVSSPAPAAPPPVTVDAPNAMTGARTPARVGPVFRHIAAPQKYSLASIYSPWQRTIHEPVDELEPEVEGPDEEEDDDTPRVLGNDVDPVSPEAYAAADRLRELPDSFAVKPSDAYVARYLALKKSLKELPDEVHDHFREAADDPFFIGLYDDGPDWEGWTPENLADAMTSLPKIAAHYRVQGGHGEPLADAFDSFHNDFQTFLRRKEPAIGTILDEEGIPDDGHDPEAPFELTKPASLASPVTQLRNRQKMSDQQYARKVDLLVAKTGRAATDFAKGESSLVPYPSELIPYSDHWEAIRAAPRLYNVTEIPTDRLLQRSADSQAAPPASDETDDADDEQDED